MRPSATAVAQARDGQDASAARAAERVAEPVAQVAGHHDLGTLPPVRVERVRKSPEYWPACAKTGAADSAGIIARRRKLHLIAVSVFQSIWLAFA